MTCFHKIFISTISTHFVTIELCTLLKLLFRTQIEHCNLGNFIELFRYHVICQQLQNPTSELIILTFTCIYNLQIFICSSTRISKCVAVNFNRTWIFTIAFRLYNWKRVVSLTICFGNCRMWTCGFACPSEIGPFHT